LLVWAIVFLSHIAFAAPSEHRFVLVSVVDPQGQPTAGLHPDSLTLTNSNTPCDIIRVTPAMYPLALVLDTSSYARADFRTMQSAAEAFATTWPDREVAVYTSGDPPSRVLELTHDPDRLSRALGRVAATPNSAPRTLETILRAARDLRARHPPLAAIIALVAGGLEMSPPPAAQVWKALSAGGSILHVVEDRALRVGRGIPQGDDGGVFNDLAVHTHGTYVRGTSAAVYASGLAAVRQRLQSQWMVEYAVPAGAPRSLNVAVSSPSIVVMAIDVRQ
jgi:hypothetical protein